MNEKTASEIVSTDVKKELDDEIQKLVECFLTCMQGNGYKTCVFIADNDKHVKIAHRGNEVKCIGLSTLAGIKFHDMAFKKPPR